MKSLSRRCVMTFASSFVAMSPLFARSGRAQAAAPAGGAVFDMANFLTPGTNADAAFAKALSAISKAANDAAKAGAGPIHIVFNLGKNAVYRISRPLAFKALHGFELNGNGAQLINTARASTLTVNGCNHLTVRDLVIDYDPLPFTQGTIVAFDKAAIQVTVKIDAGYPDDPALLAGITDGFFKVMDRGTKALKAGARDFLSATKAERISPGLIKVRLGWSTNDRFPSQLPIAVGDTVTICSSGATGIEIADSDATSLISVKLLAGHGNPGKWRSWFDAAHEGIRCSRTSPEGSNDGPADIDQFRWLALHYRRARTDDRGLHLRQHLRRRRERARFLLLCRSEACAAALSAHAEMGHWARVWRRDRELRARDVSLARKKTSSGP